MRFGQVFQNYKKQHIIMESIADHGNSGIDNDTKVYHFLQRIRSAELEAMVNIV